MGRDRMSLALSNRVTPAQAGAHKPQSMLQMRPAGG